MRITTPALAALLCLVACDDDENTGTSAPDAGTPDAAAPDLAVDAAPDPSSSWSSWAHDEAASRANPQETGITPDTVAGLSVAWTVDGPGVTSTPVVVDDVVYIGRWDGRVSALNVADGTEVWSATVSDGAPIDASVAVSETLVHVPVGNSELVALDRASGEERWRVSLSDHPDAHLFSSPTLIDDLLVIGLASVELVMVKDDYTFVGAVIGLDAATGAERWRFETTANDDTAGAGVSVWSSAAVDRQLGLVFIGTGNTYEAPASPYSDSMLAIRYATGELAWHRQFTEGDVYTVFAMPPQGPDADVGATPNLFRVGDRAVVGVGDKAGVYSVLDRASGETVWAVQTTAGSPLGGIMTSAAYHDGTVYLTSNRGVDIPELDADTNASDFIALDASNGAERWRTELEAPSFGAVAYAGGLVYATTVRGRIYALRATAGEILWSSAPSDRAASGVAVAAGRLFFGHGFSLFKAPQEVSGGLVVYALPR